MTRGVGSIPSRFFILIIFIYIYIDRFADIRIEFLKNASFPKKTKFLMQIM